MDKAALLSYFEKLKALEVGCEGRLTKMERVGDAYKYMKFCLHQPRHSQLLEDIDAAELSLSQWKTVLRREKKRLAALRLERDSNDLPGLNVVSAIESYQTNSIPSSRLERRVGRLPRSS